jgi:homoserine kinase type II
MVDRRGERLPFSELAEHWPLSGWTEVQAVAGGKNEHFRVTAGAGTFFLRRSYRSKSVRELRAQLELMQLLARRGLPVPEPVQTLHGDWHAVVGGRLWVVTGALAGAAYRADRPVHTRELGRTLAAYHQTVADLPCERGEPGPLVELRQHVGVAGLDPWLAGCAAELTREITGLAPGLPRVMIHGGARRGSVLYDGDRVAAILDFDSARPDVRVLDLAVAAHDVGKVYTVLGAEDHKVALDLTRVAELLHGYRQVGLLSPAEVEALPLLIEAKRLKRALGRLSRLRSGEALSANDHAKVDLERRRVRWLRDHRRDLADTCANRRP